MGSAARPPAGARVSIAVTSTARTRARLAERPTGRLRPRTEAGPACCAGPERGGDPCSSRRSSSVNSRLPATPARSHGRRRARAAIGGDLAGGAPRRGRQARALGGDRVRVSGGRSRRGARREGRRRRATAAPLRAVPRRRQRRPQLHSSRSRSANARRAVGVRARIGGVEGDARREEVGLGPAVEREAAGRKRRDAARTAGSGAPRRAERGGHRDPAVEAAIRARGAPPGSRRSARRPLVEAEPAAGRRRAAVEQDGRGTGGRGTSGGGEPAARPSDERRATRHEAGPRSKKAPGSAQPLRPLRAGGDRDRAGVRGEAPASGAVASWSAHRPDRTTTRPWVDPC